VNESRLYFIITAITARHEMVCRKARISYVTSNSSQQLKWFKWTWV